MAKHKSKTWYRLYKGKRIAGICSGLSDMFGIDVTLIRFIFLVLIFTPMPGSIILLYLLAWFIVPVK